MLAGSGMGGGLFIILQLIILHLLFIIYLLDNLYLIVIHFGM